MGFWSFNFQLDGIIEVSEDKEGEMNAKHISYSI